MTSTTWKAAETFTFSSSSSDLTRSSMKVRFNGKFNFYLQLVCKYSSWLSSHLTVLDKHQLEVISSRAPLAASLQSLEASLHRNEAGGKWVARRKSKFFSPKPHTYFRTYPQIVRCGSFSLYFWSG